MWYNHLLAGRSRQNHQSSNRRFCSHTLPKDSRKCSITHQDCMAQKGPNGVVTFIHQYSTSSPPPGPIIRYGWFFLCLAILPFYPPFSNRAFQSNHTLSHHSDISSCGYTDTASTREGHLFSCRATKIRSSLSHLCLSCCLVMLVRWFLGETARHLLPRCKDHLRSKPHPHY